MIRCWHGSRIAIPRKSGLNLDEFTCNNGKRRAVKRSAHRALASLRERRRILRALLLMLQQQAVVTELQLLQLAPRVVLSRLCVLIDCSVQESPLRDDCFC